MKKIVIIEDDKILREELEILLNDSGYQAEILSDFTDAAAQVRQIRPDLVLLDIILPGANGQYILRQIREKSDVPVIMLTSKDGEVEEIMSRSSGADDYVTKPYNPTILLLRIETILRRTEQTGRQSEQRASSVRGEKAEGEAVQEELQDEELRLNLLRSTVSYHGDEVVLSKNELAILHCLMSRKGQIVSRDELMDHLWDMSEFVDDNTLTVNINRLRKRLAQIGLENKIETGTGVSAIMSLKKYLKDHRLHLLLGLLAEGVVEAVLWLFASPVALQGFAFFWLTGSIGVIFGYDFLRKRKFYKKVEENLSQLEEKYLLTELLDEPEFLEGQILCRVIQEMEHSMTDTVEQQIRKNGEFKRYIETWIHEIKIPIASTNLILFNHREDMERRMKEQIRRIESYVEQVLYYLRGEVPEKDYCIGGYGLKEIVQSTVRDNKDSLILNGFSVLVELRDEKVYTDRKWLQFMLGQILSNAVKYAAEDERKIRIFTKKVQSSENSSGEAGIWLWIEDNGIGITEKDLPRIFEKSFTGDNGRKSSSTGMGLYICRRLCEELGHKILAESEPGKYTRIGILFREREADVPVGF